MIDQQSTLLLLLSWATFLLSGKWGDFVDWRKFAQAVNIFYSFLKTLKLSLFTKLYYKVNQTKANTPIYLHPFSLNHLLYAHVQCREPKISSSKGSNLKKDDSPLAIYAYSKVNDKVLSMTQTEARMMTFSLLFNLTE